jgi:anti-sigma-K factor RskA
MLNEMEHQPFIENIPAYALGALDAEESAALEAHLQACASCRDDLAAYRQISGGLLMAIPPKAPPAALRQRLRKQLPSAQRTNRPRWAWSFNPLTIGISIFILLALNLFSLFQMQSLQRQQTQLMRGLQTSQTALAMLAYPGTQSLPISANNISGALLFDKDRNVAVLIVWNLPHLQNNQTYQAWLIDRQGGRTSAAIFDVDPTLPFTSVTVMSPDELSTFTGLGVTVEPRGGSKQPTGPRLFRIDF